VGTSAGRNGGDDKGEAGGVRREDDWAGSWAVLSGEM
jgi:hypothetical protein